MRNVPPPVYDYQIEELVKHYKKAADQIKRELENLAFSDMSNANSRAALAHIAEILAELDEEANAWVAANISIAAREGVARTILALGVVKTMEEAEKIVKFNRINEEMVKAVVADTYQDLVAITQNMDRKSRAAVRKAVSEAMREQYALGINGQRTIRREMLVKFKDALGNAVDSAIVDAAGRTWKAETYIRMVSAEKMNQAHMEATMNEALERGAYYGVISSHGARDACRYHEGRIVKLIEDAEGDYPTVEALRSTNQIFHVRCRHQVNPFRRLDRLPESVREKANNQDEIGRKALAAGGRNPKIET
jgi:hypothetical protein